MLPTHARTGKEIIEYAKRTLGFTVLYQTQSTVVLILRQIATLQVPKGQLTNEKRASLISLLALFEQRLSGEIHEND